MSFASLPEDCIAHIISLTSPEDACVASAVSLGFKSAADSDTVWKRHLPSDYKDIIGRSSSSEHRLDRFSSLKELYVKLCDAPILLDDGRLSLRLIKPTGKKCYMMCARELRIACQHNPKYWRWTSLPESRFAEVARLSRVCFLAIFGTLQASILSPDTTYTAHIVFKLAANSRGLDRCLKALVHYANDDVLTRQGANVVHLVSAPARTDGWKEIELGEFFVGRDEKRKVRFHFYEAESENLDWKRGLIVDGIEIRPKE